MQQAVEFVAVAVPVDLTQVAAVQSAVEPVVYSHFAAVIVADFVLLEVDLSEFVY